MQLRLKRWPPSLVTICILVYKLDEQSDENPLHSFKEVSTIQQKKYKSIIAMILINLPPLPFPILLGNTQNLTQFLRKKERSSIIPLEHVKIPSRKYTIDQIDIRGKIKHIIQISDLPLPTSSSICVRLGRFVSAKWELSG